MTLAEKLRFLADRWEDGEEFFIGITKYAFNKQNNYLEHRFSSNRNVNCNLEINELERYEFKEMPRWEFTADEKAILRNLPEQYNWIARDDDDETMGELFVYAFKPSKFNDTWIFDEGSVIDLDHFKHLFQSVQWSDEEPCEFRRYL